MTGQVDALYTAPPAGFKVHGHFFTVTATLTAPTVQDPIDTKVRERLVRLGTNDGSHSRCLESVSDQLEVLR